MRKTGANFQNHPVAAKPRILQAGLSLRGKCGEKPNTQHFKVLLKFMGLLNLEVKSHSFSEASAEHGIPKLQGPHVAESAVCGALLWSYWLSGVATLRFVDVRFHEDRMIPETLKLPMLVVPLSL